MVSEWEVHLVVWFYGSGSHTEVLRFLHKEFNACGTLLACRHHGQVQVYWVCRSLGQPSQEKGQRSTNKSSWIELIINWKYLSVSLFFKLVLPLHGRLPIDQAEEIGKKASEFIFHSLMMDNVYDYMFHLLNEYSKLLKLKPTIPPHAIEFCAESMVCHLGREEGLVNKFMLESMLNFSKLSSPCKLPPPFSPGELSSLAGTKKKSIQRVEIWRQKSKRMNSNHIYTK